MSLWWDLNTKTMNLTHEILYCTGLEMHSNAFTGHEHPIYSQTKIGERKAGLIQPVSSVCRQHKQQHEGMLPACYVH